MHGRVDITVSCSLSNETPDTFLSFSFGFAEMMTHIVNTNQSLLVQNKQNHLSEVTDLCSANLHIVFKLLNIKNTHTKT